MDRRHGPRPPSPTTPSTIKFGAAARPASEKGILIAKLLDEREEERTASAPDEVVEKGSLPQKSEKGSLPLPAAYS